jgi:hypothetical protein
MDDMDETGTGMSFAIADEFPVSALAFGRVCSRDVCCVPHDRQSVKQTLVDSVKLPAMQKQHSTQLWKSALHCVIFFKDQ